MGALSRRLARPFPAGGPAGGGPDSTVADLLVRRAPFFRPADPAAAWVDTLSMTPAGPVWWPRDDPLALAVRAAPDARLSLILADGRRVPFAADPGPDPVPEAIRAFDHDLRNLRRPTTAAAYRAVIRGIPIGGGLPNVLASAPSGGPPPRYPVLESVRGVDTVRVLWPLTVALLDSAPAARLDDGLLASGTVDGITVGRAHPGATYHWFFPAGTLARVSGRIGDDLRLRLAAGLVAWVGALEASPMPAALVARPARVGSVLATPGPDRTVVRIPITRRVPWWAGATGDRLHLTLYDAAADLNWIRYGTGAEPDLLRLVTWRQAADRVELDFQLAGPVWGYRVEWEGEDLLVTLRRPPRIDPSDPLAGRLIVVDPGHPPGGATGPTGLTEAEATLAVARVVRELLEARGARVILTRDGPGPVGLGARPRLADSVGADLLVSIHANALPDGVNPFTNNGSSVFYFNPPSLPLARAIQRALARYVAVPVLGVARGDLALVRPTWMPAALVEGLFMMVPEQEAALRSDEGRRRYATAVVEGVAEFLAGVAGAPGGG